MRELARNFLDAAQRLGDAMLVDLRDKDPTLALAVATAVENGERMMIAFTLGDAPAIELLTQNDYRQVKQVASIALQGKTGALN